MKPTELRAVTRMPAKSYPPNVTQPSRSLLDPNKETQHQYVKADNTDLKAQWAAWFAEHRKPETADSYQRSAIWETR